jgi:hypothetical protein
VWKRSDVADCLKSLLGRWREEVKRSPNAVLVVLCALGVLACLVSIGTGDLNARESLLLSVVLTIISIMGSWVLSRYYAETSFNENLRTFALKAAEKVDNLSKELDRLAVYLQQELDDTDYRNAPENLMGKEYRIEGAIHMLSTLKSVNDRSLSDWQGVIGKELDERREEQEQREEQLRELIERVDSLSLTQAATPTKNADALEGALKGEINAIRADLRVLASQVGGVPLRRSKTSRVEVDNPCPKCTSVVHYRQREKLNSVKAVRCSNCDARLVSLPAGDGFRLVLREPIKESVACPGCDAPMDVLLDPVPGSSMLTRCRRCGGEVRVNRNSRDITLRLGATKNAPVALTEEIIANVERVMPPQPWPKGASRKVAEGLGLPQSTVAKAVKELIRRGKFQMQLEGRLYNEVLNGQQPTAPACNGH